MHRTPLEFDIGSKLDSLVLAMVDSYQGEPSTQHIDRAVLPSNAETAELIDRLLELMYPGFIGRQNLTAHNVAYHVGELLPRIGWLAFRQIHKCFCYMAEQDTPGPPRDECRARAGELTIRFLEGLPAVRDLLAGDVQAALDGDPAALNKDEIILAYPGLLAVTVYRLAHVLYSMDIPILPRIITERAHAQTGVDIHPGAKIGSSFFIDHGTGVVIGETTDIGQHVKLYQGVTLGALSFPKDEKGRLIRGAKRHPTVEDHVTIYANAIVLGGDTCIGRHAVVGGSVFLTSSVPPYCTVTLKPPELRVKERDAAGRETEQIQCLPDFQI